MSKIHKRKIKFFGKEISSWYCSNGRSFWWRKYLHVLNPFQVLLLETLLWKTRAETVADRARLFIEKYDTPRKITSIPTNKLAEDIKPFGLYNRRSRLLKDLASTLISDHDSRIPNDEKILVSLPGIGQYISRATLLFAYSAPIIPIDVNVKRVIERFFSLEIKNIRKLPGNIIQLLDDIVVNQDPQLICWGLIDLGASTCVASIPLCSSCPLKKKCDHSQGNNKA